MHWKGPPSVSKSVSPAFHGDQDPSRQSFSTVRSSVLLLGSNRARLVAKPRTDQVLRSGGGYRNEYTANTLQCLLARQKAPALSSYR